MNKITILYVHKIQFADTSIELLFLEASYISPDKVHSQHIS